METHHALNSKPTPSASSASSQATNLAAISRRFTAKTHPLATSAFLNTGSGALNRAFGADGPRRGQLFEVASAEASTQRKVLIAICRAALERGERVVFFDLSDERKSNPLKDEALCQIFAPTTMAAMHTQLRSAMQAPTLPSVVVVDSVFELLPSAKPQRAMSEKEVSQVGRSVYTLLHDCKRLGLNNYTTFFFTYPLAQTSPSNGKQLPPVSWSVRNTLSKYAHLALTLGPEATQNLEGLPLFTVPVRVSRDGSVSPSASQTLTLNGEGTFHNS